MGIHRGFYIQCLSWEHFLKALLHRTMIARMIVHTNVCSRSPSTVNMPSDQMIKLLFVIDHSFYMGIQRIIYDQPFPHLYYCRQPMACLNSCTSNHLYKAFKIMKLKKKAPIDLLYCRSVLLTGSKSAHVKIILYLSDSADSLGISQCIISRFTFSRSGESITLVSRKDWRVAGELITILERASQVSFYTFCNIYNFVVLFNIWYFHS